MASLDNYSFTPNPSSIEFSEPYKVVDTDILKDNNTPSINKQKLGNEISEITVSGWLIKNSQTIREQANELEQVLEQDQKINFSVSSKGINMMVIPEGINYDKDKGTKGWEYEINLLRG